MDNSRTKSTDEALGPELWARLQWESDLWIFAPGAPVAAPAFPFFEAAPALRDESGACFGIAYRVPAIDVPAALEDVSRSNRRNRSPGLQEIEVETAAGPVTAFAFGRRQPDLSQRKAA